MVREGRNCWIVIGLIASLSIIFGTSSSIAAEPGWSPVVIATGCYRERLEATPIHKRPYRPFHFYGNTIRRIYYRGNPLPLPIDLVRTARSLTTRQYLKRGDLRD